MGSGLCRKKNQCKEAAPKYKISNVFERKGGFIQQGRVSSLITEALSQEMEVYMKC